MSSLEMDIKNLIFKQDDIGIVDNSLDGRFSDVLELQNIININENDGCSINTFINNVLTDKNFNVFTLRPESSTEDDSVVTTTLSSISESVKNTFTGENITGTTVNPIVRLKISKNT